MAISELTGQRNTNGGGASTSVTFTFPSAPTSGNLVVLGFSWRGDATVTAVPHSCSLATNGGNGSGIDSAIYYKIANGTEGTAWTFTLSTSQKSSGIGSEWSGIDPTPLDKINSGTATSTSGNTGATGTLTLANELVVALYGNINTNTWSSYGGATTEIGQQASTGGSGATRNNTAMAASIVTSTASVTGTATLSGSQVWSSAIATFKAAPNAYSLTAEPGSYTVTGQTATILKTSLLTANNGSYALTGQDATITYTPITGYTITADAGSYTVTGQAATITYYQNFTVTADAGAYSITGQAATLLKTRILSASNGSYTLTGQTATIDYGVPPRMAWLLMEDGFALLQEDGGHLLLEPLEFIVIAQNGAYTITGQAAALSRSYNITAENGSYTITGQAAEIDRGYLLTADAGSYTLTGQSANILKTRILTADAGSYALTGQASDIILGRLISAEFGIYNVDGQPATINFESRTVGDVWIHLRSFTERRRF